MAEAVAVAASVIAIIQVADRIIGACKTYISSVRDAPSDLRVILLEISALKPVFENLKFLNSCHSPCSPMFDSLCGVDGPVEGCLSSVNELAALFPPDNAHVAGQGQSKHRKIKHTLVSLAWPLKQTKARKLLDDILRYKSTITLVLTTDTFQDIKDTKVKASEIHDIVTEIQREETYRWLHHTDPSPNHHRAQKNYESGTGDWILRYPEWISWLEAKTRSLWIRGIPGAGKTVLMSHLIEQIKKICDQSPKRDITYAFYYCYFAHKQDETKPFLKWLISRLCRKADHVPASINELRKNGGEPNVADLLTALASILTKFEVVYVAVDAIDESDLREDLLMVFQDLVTESRFKKLQLIASSREYIDIERKMAKFSVSVSMNNPYVEMDIRRYVKSILQSCDRFGPWPLELLHEVEETVTMGAKGMFRWAVCQLDALKRLKSERHIVMKALKNLPKTLDETYDRIFTIIPTEERLFVHHVLRWIAYHNDLWNGDGMPCEVLIQAAGTSTVMINGQPNERSYDQDTLREICGCLIEVSSREIQVLDGTVCFTCSSVAFAHYTVLEYLESGRMSKSALTYYDAVEELRKEKLIEITMSEAQSIESQKLWITESAVDHHRVIEAVYSNFTNYCAVLSILSLYRFADCICRQSLLTWLAVDFLNPSKSHFEDTVMIASGMEQETNFSALTGGMAMHTMFWDIEWNPDVDTNARHIYLLLLLYDCRPVYKSLIENILQRKDYRHLLQSRLSFRMLTTFSLSYREQDAVGNLLFEGSIIEVIVQRSGSYRDNVSFLMEIGAELFDPSVVLLLSIGTQDFEEDCGLTQHLLELEADPNLTSYIVTPLQIATYRLDFDGVSMLLKYGAHPNSTGYDDGVAWKQDTIMSYLSHLHGASPLRILRKYRYITPQTEKEHYYLWILEARKELEELLLQYGAEEISSTPEAASEEVKYDTLGWKEWAMTSPQTRARTISNIDDYSLNPPANTPNNTEKSLSGVDNSSDNDILPAFLTKILN